MALPHGPQRQRFVDSVRAAAPGSVSESEPFVFSWLTGWVHEKIMDLGVIIVIKLRCVYFRAVYPHEGPNRPLSVEDTIFVHVSGS